MRKLVPHFVVAVLSLVLPPTLLAATAEQDGDTLPGSNVLAASALLAVDQNRATIVERIVNEWGDRLVSAGAGVSKAQLKEMLSAMRADQLLAASLAGSLDGLKAIVVAATPSSGKVRIADAGGIVPNALGDANADLLYTPVSPCRLFDTRLSQQGLGTPTPGVRRTYGAITPVPQQGGPGGCTAGAGATVALIQIGALSPAGNGLLQAGAQGAASFPNALILYQPGDQYGATVAMPLNPANGQFDLLEQFAAADLYGDLLGYFKPAAGFVSAVAAGAGITVTGTTVPTIAVQGGYRLPQGCTNGQVAKSDGAGGWTCAADSTGSGGITSLTQGAGTILSPNPISVTGSISVDTTTIQQRVSGACAVGSSIRAIAADGTVTCQTDNAGPANAFVQGGNSLGVTAKLGTNDNNPLEFYVNGARMMRYAPSGESPNLIGGHPNNSVDGAQSGQTVAGGGLAGSNCSDGRGGVRSCGNQAAGYYLTISGGVANVASSRGATVGGGQSNAATSSFSTVGGGSDNIASTGTWATVGGGGRNTANGPTSSTVAGGIYNTASGGSATVGGGSGNTASNGGTTVAGGGDNIASGYASVVGGGFQNLASGQYSAVPGGRGNQASGEYSVALGRRAIVNSAGSFVFSDGTDADFFSGVNNEFIVGATGGVGFYTSKPTYAVYCKLPAGAGAWSCSSDRAVKSDIVDVRGDEMLRGVLALPISTWRFSGEPEGTRHVGPMAQDFYGAFGLGNDEKAISTVDAQGVALAAIQGLNAKLETKVAEQAREIAELRRAVEVLMARTSLAGKVVQLP